MRDRARRKWCFARSPNRTIFKLLRRSKARHRNGKAGRKRNDRLEEMTGFADRKPGATLYFPRQEQGQDRIETTENGGHRRQNSTEATAVKALQDHAAKVTDLAQRGMVAAHEAMSRNGRAMMGGVREAKTAQHHRLYCLPRTARDRVRISFNTVACLVGRFGRPRFT